MQYDRLYQQQQLSLLLLLLLLKSYIQVETGWKFRN